MTVEVGFGSAVITPDLPVVLAGFGVRKGPVTDVHDDLEVHALLVRDGGTTLCLLVLDLLLLGPDFAAPIRSAVAAALQVPRAHVLTSSTHTHSGPAATRWTRRIGWAAPAAYLERLVAACVDAATTACAAAEPADLGYARASLPAALSLNRRGLPYDPTFAVLEARRRDGSVVGTVANVGIHPVALGVTCRAISGDWVASYRAAARAATAAPAMLLPGALGDVNPTRDPHTDPTPGGNWETARVLGTEVADCVRQLLPAARPIGGDTGLVASRSPRVRAGLTLPALLAGAAGRRVLVDLVEWSVGGLRLVSLPGEAFSALGAAVLADRDGPALLAGIAPAWHGYLPVPWGHGYEERMSFGRRFVRDVTRQLVGASDGEVP